MNLERLIPFYRRDTDEQTGAVRVSAITTVAVEQMPGGRAQISARTLSGEQQFLSAVMVTYREALEMLEAFRLFCGGESDVNPAEVWLAARSQSRRLVEEAEQHALRARDEVERSEAAATAAAKEDVWRPPTE